MWVRLKFVFTILFAFSVFTCHAWGFFGHRQINYYAVFLLPPQMMALYKPNIDFIAEHAVDPDKRRYAIKEEAPRHFIDIDNYGKYPYDSLPRQWKKAVEKYGEAQLNENGIVPWWVQTMLSRLTAAFKAKDQLRILKLSAELGHYVADAHVPLHASSNHNGQLTDQIGIHAFWESRIPEMFAERQYDFLIGKAEYISNPGNFIWEKVLQSAAAADSVLKFEQTLNATFPADQKYSYEERLGKVVRQYSAAYTTAYQDMLKGMVERRMRESIYAVASFWFTAWVNAGQPNLNKLFHQTLSEEELKEYDEMDQKMESRWKYVRKNRRIDSLQKR